MAAASLPLDSRQRRRPLSPGQASAASSLPLDLMRRQPPLCIHGSGDGRGVAGYVGDGQGDARVARAPALRSSGGPPSNVSRRCSYFRVQLRSSRCPTSSARAVHPRLRPPVPPTPSIVWPPASPRQVLQPTSCLHPPRDPDSKSLMHLVSFTPWILQNRSRSRLLLTVADVQGMDGKINSRLVGKMKSTRKDDSAPALSFRPSRPWTVDRGGCCVRPRLVLSSPPATQRALAPLTLSSGALLGERPPSFVILLHPSRLSGGVVYWSRCRQAVALGAHSYGGTQRRMVGSRSLGL